jgi:hypothetical protein
MKKKSTLTYVSVLFLFGLAIYFAWPNEEKQNQSSVKAMQVVPTKANSPKPNLNITKREDKVELVDAEISFGG